MKNWKGKTYKDPRSGKVCPMISEWKYRYSPGKAGVRFIPQAKVHAFKVLEKTRNLTQAAASVGVSFPAFRRWLAAADIDHTQYKNKNKPGPKTGRKASKKKTKKAPGGRATTVRKKKKSSTGNRFNHNEIFMACYMHRHGFSNDAIRKRIGKVSDKTLTRWFDDYGIEMDLSVIDQADRIKAMLALSSGTSDKDVSKEFDINLGIVQQIKTEMETQIGGL